MTSEHKPHISPSMHTRALLAAMAEVDRLSDPYLHLADSRVPLQECNCVCVNEAYCHCDDGGCDCSPEEE